MSQESDWEDEIKEATAIQQLKIDTDYWKPQVEAKDAEIARLKAKIDEYGTFVGIANLANSEDGTAIVLGKLEKAEAEIAALTKKLGQAEDENRAIKIDCDHEHALRMHDEQCSCYPDFKRELARAEQAEAREKALREALEKIDVFTHSQPSNELYGLINRLAKQALSQPPEEGK